MREGWGARGFYQGRSSKGGLPPTLNGSSPWIFFVRTGRCNRCRPRQRGAMDQAARPHAHESLHLKGPTSGGQNNCVTCKQVGDPTLSEPSTKSWYWNLRPLNWASTCPNACFFKLLLPYIFCSFKGSFGTRCHFLESSFRPNPWAPMMALVGFDVSPNLALI